MALGEGPPLQAPWPAGAAICTTFAGCLRHSRDGAGTSLDLPSLPLLARGAIQARTRIARCALKIRCKRPLLDSNQRPAA